MKLLACFAILAGMVLWLSLPERRAHGAARGTPPRRAVIVAVRRDHRLQFFDAATLAPLGSVAIYNLADSVEARPDGGMLYIRQAVTPDGNGCCALFALDLATSELCRLLFPATQPVPVTGDRLFAQRGNTGIDVFDAASLEHLPTIAAPGVYSLAPSPDGRWLFGANHFREASLDLMDVRAGALLRRLPVALPGADGSPQAPNWLSGAWLDGQFYLYASDADGRFLWTVSPNTSELDTPTAIDAAGSGPLPDLLSDVIAADGRLFVYERRSW